MARIQLVAANEPQQASRLVHVRFAPHSSHPGPFDDFLKAALPRSSCRRALQFTGTDSANETIAAANNGCAVAPYNLGSRRPRKAITGFRKSLAEAVVFAG